MTGRAGTVLVSAADAGYGEHVLNLIGSVKSNSDVFDRIVVYDLGLGRLHRLRLSSIPGVELRRVPPFVPHWSQCYTWKPWIWTHTKAALLLYLDAGITVLRSLEDPLAQIRERGYFLVSQEHPVDEIVPTDYRELYGLPDDLGGRDTIAAGIIGFRPGGQFFERVIEPTYEDALAGRTLGWSPDEARRNAGINRLDSMIIRSCQRFRHDQTLLNIHVLVQMPDAQVNELAKYGGWQSAHDHPEQLIWNHRRPGPLLFTERVPYRRWRRPLLAGAALAARERARLAVRAA